MNIFFCVTVSIFLLFKWSLSILMSSVGLSACLLIIATFFLSFNDLLSDNDSRVQFLTELGWDVAASPVESGQVRIPEEDSPVFDRYNALQKSNGYDLSTYAGKNVMRYVYKINNYPGATEPVYATLLVYKNQIIGGDVTDTAARGKIQGF